MDVQQHHDSQQLKQPVVSSAASNGGKKGRHKGSKSLRSTPVSFADVSPKVSTQQPQTRHKL